jgi:phospholipid-binding lipoprotein MlaA
VSLPRPRLPRRGLLRAPLLAAATVAALAGCARSPDPASLTFDPLEAQNREAHDFNVQVDRTSWGPAARAYGTTVPEAVRTGIKNLRANWRLPHQTIQYGLQGRPALAGRSAMRFVVNTFFGVGGLFDPATAGGVELRYTNIDETLHVWGVREGAYLVLPYGGPGTERDWTGWVLDLALDPVNFVLPTGALQALLGVGALDLVNDRYVLDPVLQTILYESADSYTALRISYLQAMRARLQGGTDLETLEDIYDF